MMSLSLSLVQKTELLRLLLRATKAPNEGQNAHFKPETIEIVAKMLRNFG